MVCRIVAIATGWDREEAMTQAKTIADWLYDQHTTRQDFRSHADLKAGGLEIAYAVQDYLVARRCQARNEIVAGYKIGVTTPRMQEMVGLSHPIAGAIVSGGIMTAPAELICANYVRLGLECEVAVRLSAPLDARKGPPARAEIAEAIGEIAAAFEIIEDRNADYKTLDMPSLVADDSWNAGMIAGAPRPLFDLADVQGRLSINGALVDTGSTADVLGHPLNSIAWLCEHLGRREQRIEAGQWIMTGTIIPTRFAKPGDHYVFEIEDLAPVEVRIV